MVETPESNREEPSAPFTGAGMGSPEVKAWFLREVLPLESLLMQFLRHNWREQGDVEDILHDVYIRVYEAASRQIPDHTKPFLFTTARNLLISRVRKRQAADPLDSVGEVIALEGVHYAAGEPFGHESRLIALAAVPDARDVDFSAIAPGSWLLDHVAWSDARHRIAAVPAEPHIADLLGIPVGTSKARLFDARAKLRLALAAFAGDHIA